MSGLLLLAGGDDEPTTSKDGLLPKECHVYRVPVGVRYEAMRVFPVYRAARGGALRSCVKASGGKLVSRCAHTVNSEEQLGREITDMGVAGPQGSIRRRKSGE